MKKKKTTLKDRLTLQQQPQNPLCVVDTKQKFWKTLQIKSLCLGKDRRIYIGLHIFSKISTRIYTKYFFLSCIVLQCISELFHAILFKEMQKMYRRNNQRYLLTTFNFLSLNSLCNSNPLLLFLHITIIMIFFSLERVFVSYLKMCNYRENQV